MNRIPALLLAFFIGSSAIVGQVTRQRRAPKRSPTPSSEKIESACGVRKTLDELIEELRVKWRIAAVGKEAKFYYNTQDMLCDRMNGVLKVWIKEVPETPREEAGGVRVVHTMQRLELKCRGRQYRLTSYANYDANGNVTLSDRIPDADWLDAIPDSVAEGMMSTVCHWP